MSDCNEFYARLNLYLDNELEQGEKVTVEEHLEECQSCQEVLQRERWFKHYMAKSAPLYKAPDNLRIRVAAILSAAPVAPPVHPLTAARQMLFGEETGLFNGTRRAIISIASVLLFLLGLWIAMIMFIPSQSVTFASVAVDTYQRHRQGRLPLELISESPEQITSWFNGKTPFKLELPNYTGELGENKLYRLLGARLVAFKDDYAAYVSYIMGERLISLMVASSDVASPTGREKIPSKDLTIYYDTIDELKVITWSHRGLTYALVSNLEERGQQSCLVCHRDIEFAVRSQF